MPKGILQDIRMGDSHMTSKRRSVLPMEHIRQLSTHVPLARLRCMGNEIISALGIHVGCEARIQTSVGPDMVTWVGDKNCSYITDVGDITPDGRGTSNLSHKLLADVFIAEDMPPSTSSLSSPLKPGASSEIKL